MSEHEKHDKKHESRKGKTEEETAQLCHDELIATLQKHYPAPPAEPPNTDSSDMTTAEAILAAARGQKVMAKKSRMTLLTVEDLLGSWTIVG